MQKASADYSIVLPMAALAPSRGQPRPEDAALEFSEILAASLAQDTAGGKLAPAGLLIAARATVVLGEGPAFGADAGDAPENPVLTSLAAPPGRPTITPAGLTPSPTDAPVFTTMPLAGLQPTVLADALPEKGHGEMGDAIPLRLPVDIICPDQAEVSLKPKPKGACRGEDDDSDSSATLIGGQSQNPASRPVPGLPGAKLDEPDAVAAHEIETRHKVEEQGQQRPAIETTTKMIGVSTVEAPAQPLSAGHATAVAKWTSLGAVDPQITVAETGGRLVSREGQSVPADEQTQFDQDTSGKTAAKANSFDMLIPGFIAPAAALAGSVAEPYPAFETPDPETTAVWADTFSDPVAPLPRAATDLQRTPDVSAFLPSSMAARSVPLAERSSTAEAKPTPREAGADGPDLVQTTTSQAQSQFMSLAALPSAMIGLPLASSFVEIEALADLAPEADPDNPSSATFIPPALPSLTARSDGSLFVPASRLAPQIIAFIETSSDTSTLLALDPEELGSISLRLESDASSPDRMIVMISAERPETLDLFRRHAAELADALRDAGYSGADIGFAHHEGGGQERPKDGAKGFLMTQAPEDAVSGPARPQTFLGTSLDLRL